MKERMSKAVLDVKMSGIREYGALAKAQPGCLMLTIGEPDFETNDKIKAKVSEDLESNLTHYPEGNGEPYLRQAIARFEAERNGYDYTADEVIVTAGATGALFCALTGVIDPGDEVIVPTPAFGVYESIIKLNHGVYVAMPTADDQFQITREALEKAASSKTKAIVINSPTNPTGCVLNEKSLENVCQFALEKNIFVICDDVYSQLVFTENYRSLASFRQLRNRLILVNSFSKPYAMTGWRVGYICADAPMRAELQKVNQNTIVSVPAFVQHACETALTMDTTAMRETYRRRRDFVCSRLADMGLEAVKPEGAFYVFPSIKKFGLDSDTFCRRMIKEALVAAVPGWCFDAEGYLRISYCYADDVLAECMDRMERFVKSL